MKIIKVDSCFSCPYSETPEPWEYSRICCHPSNVNADSNGESTGISAKLKAGIWEKCPLEDENEL